MRGSAMSATSPSVKPRFWRQRFRCFALFSRISTRFFLRLAALVEFLGKAGSLLNVGMPRHSAELLFVAALVIRAQSSANFPQQMQPRPVAGFFFFFSLPPADPPLLRARFFPPPLPLADICLGGAASTD